MTGPESGAATREVLDSTASLSSGAALGEPPAGPPDGTNATLPFAAFLGVAVAAIGGPLALTAVYVPAVVADVAGSAGLVAILGVVAFTVPVVIWLRYSRHVAGPGGLTAFVEQAAGHRVALVQASVWTLSYGLYLLYTSAYVVYDVLPAVVPGVAAYQPALELLLPAAIAAVVLAPGRVGVAVVGALAAAQVALVVLLVALTLGSDAPAGAFTTPVPAGEAALAAGNVAVLYVCGSLPLFLGGEVRRRHTVRRGIGAAYALVAALVVLAVVPFASNPAFTRAEIPGMAFARVTGGPAAAVVIGLGVAASIVGVMMVEFLAVTRLVHAMTGRSIRSVGLVLATVLVAAGPVSLIDPDRFYLTLLRPSLVALWVAQLIVVVVYPRFAARHGRLRVGDLALSAGAVVVMGFGLYSSVANQVAT
ncbi:MAG TPA: hypothetical protein VFJ19_07970 [Nocardioidaceae bacterium]|nr:hypothetical protein [Nocardioidaceae bacterium]